MWIETFLNVVIPHRRESRRALLARCTVCAGSPPARGRRESGDDGFKFLVFTTCE
nr:hypothetical protein [Coxiella burnetii]